MSTQRVVRFELDEAARKKVRERLRQRQEARATRAAQARNRALARRLGTLAAEPTAAKPLGASAVRVAAAQSEETRTSAIPKPAATHRLADVVAENVRLATALAASGRPARPDVSEEKTQAVIAYAVEEAAARLEHLTDPEVTAAVTAAVTAVERGKPVDVAELYRLIDDAELREEARAAQEDARQLLLAQLQRSGFVLDEGIGLQLPHQGHLVVPAQTEDDSVTVGAEVWVEGDTVVWQATRLRAPGDPDDPAAEAEAGRQEEQLCDGFDDAVGEMGKAGISAKAIKSLRPRAAEQQVVAVPPTRRRVVVRDAKKAQGAS